MNVYVFTHTTLASGMAENKKKMAAAEDWAPDACNCRTIDFQAEAWMTPLAPLGGELAAASGGAELGTVTRR